MSQARKNANKLRADFISVREKGAVGDGVTDDSAAFQLAVNEAISTGRRKVYVAAGTYNFAAASPAIDPGTTDITFFGDGFHSILQFNEGPALPVAQAKHLFKNVSGAMKGTVSFRDLHLRGDWQERGFAAGSGSAMFFENFTGINFHNIKISNFGFTGTTCERILNVKVIDSTFEQCARDMCRFRSSFNVQIEGCRFKNCDDDPIALHQLDLYSNVPGQIREGIVVTGNIFEDTGSVRVLGGRMVAIRNNIMRRSKTAAILVYEDSTNATEGDVPMFGIDISGNRIFDTLDRAPFGSPAFSVIAVYGRGRKGGSLTSGIVPGENEVGTGAFVRPWNWRSGRWANATDGYPPVHYLHITDNTICRTLPAVANYSTWGYGQAMTATGFSDAAVSEAALRPVIGINIEGDVRRAIVQRNIVSHVNYNIYVNEPSSNYAMDQLKIADNLFSDFSVAGVLLDPAATFYNVGIDVSGNHFDGDPYHNNPNRGSNGTWLTANGNTAFVANQFANWTFSRNHIRNVTTVLASDFFAFGIVQANVLRCQPAATGFSTSNKGIGNVPMGGISYNFEMVNSDPAAAAYGQTLNENALTRASIPTSGLYARGTFIQADGSTTVYGWYRLTTGTAHVAGTDWKTIALT